MLILVDEFAQKGPQYAGTDVSGQVKSRLIYNSIKYILALLIERSVPIRPYHPRERVLSLLLEKLDCLLSGLDPIQCLPWVLVSFYGLG